MATNHDYLAIIPIGGGSSWGRSPNKDEAVDNAIRSLKDWMVYYDLSNVEVTVNVIDVAGYTDCTWGGGRPGGWIHGKNKTGDYEPIKRDIEHVQRMTPKWKKGKRHAG